MSIYSLPFPKIIVKYRKGILFFLYARFKINPEDWSCSFKLIARVDVLWSIAECGQGYDASPLPEE